MRVQVAPVQVAVRVIVWTARDAALQRLSRFSDRLCRLGCAEGASQQRHKQSDFSIVWHVLLQALLADREDIPRVLDRQDLHSREDPLLDEQLRLEPLREAVREHGIVAAQGSVEPGRLARRRR